MNLNFKLLIPLVLIVVICGLIRYSVYAHNKISDLESDISDYEKAYEEVSKARIHYEEISKSQEDYYLNILNKLNNIINIIHIHFDSPLINSLSSLHLFTSCWHLLTIARDR